MPIADQEDRTATQTPNGQQELAPIDDIASFLGDTISQSDPTPLYEQIIAAIATAIRDGRLAPGTALPPEPEFAQRLGLSRQTVGQALAILARRGLITRRRGIGTFVNGTPVEQPLDRLYSFIRILAEQENPPDVRLLGARLTVDSDASPFLTSDVAGIVFELTRLFLANGTPLVFEAIYLPATCGERLPAARLATDVIYDLLREECGIDVSHGEETFRLALLESAEAALLGVSLGDPAFLVERSSFAGDLPVEFRRSFIRGDRSSFRVRLEGPTLIPTGSES